MRRFILLIALCGCAATPQAEPVSAVPEPAAPAHTHAPAHAPLPATGGSGYTAADVRFMQNMIGHHAQAITMAAMAPTHGASNKLLKLAQKIDISQRDEIGMMKHWLTARQQAIPADHEAHAMMMPGMLDATQLAQLDAARGADFDRLFLTYMIRHHRGALKMVEELFQSSGAGQDSDIFRFATDVDADQRDEIYVMQTLLDTLQEPK
jgi:uncharacterized protein (DUF305 family)